MPMSPSFIGSNNQITNINMYKKKYTSTNPRIDYKDSFSNYNKSVFFDEEKGIHFISSNIKNNPQYTQKRKPKLY